MTSSPILIIDGNNFAFRSMVVPSFKTDNGIPTSVIYSLLTSLIVLLKKFNTNHFVFVWDKGISTKRVEIYDQYKANRKIMTDEEREIKQLFLGQLKLAQKIFDFLNFAQISIWNVEADDILSILANLFSKYKQSIIVSSDKDLLQCLNVKLNVYNPSKKILYNFKTFFEIFNVSPPRYLFARTMIGDPSDNIKGIHGVGDKTAFKIVDDLKRVNVNELVDLMHTKKYCKKKFAEKIIEGKDIIIRNYRLMKLPVKSIELGKDRKKYLDIVTKEWVAKIFKRKMVNKKKFKLILKKLEMNRFLGALEYNRKMLNITWKEN